MKNIFKEKEKWKMGKEILKIIMIIKDSIVCRADKKNKHSA